MHYITRSFFVARVKNPLLSQLIFVGLLVIFDELANMKYIEVLLKN